MTDYGMPLPRPMLATLGTELPRGKDWTYEVKWDGYRALAVKGPNGAQLISRNQKQLTTDYPSVVRAIDALPVGNAVLDGEKGHPSFQALHHRSAHTIVYYAFDLLRLNGRDRTRVPLDQRRAALLPLLKHSDVLHSEPLPGTPEEIEKAIRGLQLEGVVAKRRRSLYESGKRSPSWVKVKFNRRQEFVIGGFKPNATNFESLLAGYYEGRKLLFAARLRAGLTAHARADIFAAIGSGQTARCPFVNLPGNRTGHWGEGVTEQDMAKLRWVKPKVVVEISFVEWTRDGILRHAEFVGVRDDKKPRDVRRERDS